jgi:hypothetical protein
MVCLVFNSEDGGRHPPLAYKTALALIVSLQVIAIIWFARPDRWLPGAILRTLFFPGSVFWPRSTSTHHRPPLGKHEAIANYAR